MYDYSDSDFSPKTITIMELQALISSLELGHFKKSKLGCFQLVGLNITELKDHMICYNSKPSLLVEITAFRLECKSCKGFF